MRIFIIKKAKMPKNCKTCDQIKDAELFYKRPSDDKLYFECISCCLNQGKKQCISCGKIKLFDEYGLYQSGNHMSKCKECVKEYKKKHQQENKEKIREYKKQYREENIDKIKKKDNNYYKDNKNKIKEQRNVKKEEIKIYQKKYRDENKTTIQENMKEYREKNKDKIKEQQKEYYSREDVIDRRREYMTNKYHSDIGFNIACKLRSRLRDALKENWKTGGTLELLGCDIEFFEKWIEYQFDVNMSWDNCGSYFHLDHIKPCAKFDLSKEEDQKICFHWSNMQPLYGPENISKNDKYDEKIKFKAEIMLKSFLIRQQYL